MTQTRPAALGCLFLLGTLLGAGAPRARADTIKVLVYGDSGSVSDQAAAITNASGAGTTFSVTATSSTASITAGNLANFDVFYAASSFGHDLDSFAAVLQNFLSTRGGIVVGQPNVISPISWLPSSLSVNVVNDDYHHSGGTNSLTAAGAASPIFAGLAASALGGPPFDTVRTTGLGSGWTVLALNTESSDVDVAMASGAFGGHRALLWPDRFDSNIYANPTSTLIRQAFQWTAAPNVTAAVPEPASLVTCLIGVSTLLGAARLARRTHRAE
jgi:hypothetical protein